MRRQYLDLARRRVARGDWTFPWRAWRSVRRAASGQDQPLLGTLIVTYRCDLDCPMCDLPQRGDRVRELDTDGLRGVMDAFKDLGVLGVGITGGEPLLRRDLLDLIRHGDRLGLLMHVNTNGSLVTEKVAREWAGAGLASVNVSLDGPDAATHDASRGGRSFGRVLRAVARLCAVPRRPYRVALTCAVGRNNVRSISALLARARDLGVDRVGFLPVHDFAGDRIAPQTVEERAALAALSARAGRDPLVDNSREYLDLFGPAFSGEKNPVACAAPRTSIVVDCYGEVFPCVPLNAVRKSVGSGDVREAWRSETYRAARESLRECRACYWNCHTEMNIALARWEGRV